MQTSSSKQDWQGLLQSISELVRDFDNPDLEDLLFQAKQTFDDVGNQLAQLQQRLKAIQQSQLSETERLLAYISYNLRHASTIEEMLEDAAAEVCNLLQVEHVIIHRFRQEWNALIEVEHIIDPQHSLIGKSLPSSYFELEWLQCYERGIARVIGDMQSEASSASSLAELGVKSSIAVSIPSGFRLAGLVIIHQYDSARRWQEWEISFLEQMVLQLAVHMHQLSLLERAQAALYERKQIEKRLLHNSLHDSLTRLPNRAFLMERLCQVCERAKTSSYLFALLFIDLDCFKSINDSLGHTIGDRLLIAFSERLQTYLRNSDTLARLGGDEFVVLLDGIVSPDMPMEVAERILQALKSPFTIGNTEIHVSVSIGILVGNANYSNPDELLRDSDVAMYRAKKSGKGRYVVFESNMLNLTLKQFQLDSDLHQAIKQHQLSLKYQPIISLTRNKLIGFEALVCWEHPSLGFIPPDSFIFMAEENGLIVEIGQWVLYEACRQIQIWQNQFPEYASLSISVNVSGAQIMQPNFVSQIEEVLQALSINPSSLKLEITETVLMKNVEACRSKLQALQAIGVQVYIDDFGIGHSSFSYLQNFQVDVIKIDRSFIRDITSDSKSFKIVQAILNLASDMGISVIAEGVETSEQLTSIREIGINNAQGYLIARPLESFAVSDWIRGH